MSALRVFFAALRLQNKAARNLTLALIRQGGLVAHSNIGGFAVNRGQWQR